MRAAGRLLVAMMVLGWLAYPVASGPAGEARQDDSGFHGWTFDAAPFYLWLPVLDGRITAGDTSASSLAASWVMEWTRAITAPGTGPVLA